MSEQQHIPLSINLDLTDTPRRNSRSGPVMHATWREQRPWVPPLWVAEHHSTGQDNQCSHLSGDGLPRPRHLGYSYWIGRHHAAVTPLQIAEERLAHWNRSIRAESIWGWAIAPELTRRQRKRLRHGRERWLRRCLTGYVACS
jgi:hypothetical protein